jgi:hypothetical protein
MASASELLEWIRANPAVSVPAISALLVVIVGGLLQLFGHWLDNRTAVAIQQMKLRHSIAQKGLEEFGTHLGRVRTIAEELWPGHLLGDDDDVLRVLRIINSFCALIDGLADRALTLSLGFRDGRRDAAGELILDAATQVIGARNAVSGEWQAWLKKHPKEVFDLESKPVLFAVSRRCRLELSASLATLYAALSWASEARIARHQLRADHASITRFLRGMERFLAEANVTEDTRGDPG